MTVQDSPVLSLAHLPVPDENLLLPGYDVSLLNIGVLHIGISAFHRAHQCTYFERLANLGETGCGVFGVSLQSAEVHELLERQDHLYTMTTLMPDTPIQVMGCIRGSAGPADLDQALSLFESASVSLVTLTVTEKAYRSSESVMVQFLVSGLRRRAQLGLPLVIASCDNLASNGDRLKQLVIEGFNEDKTLQKWVESRVSFPCSMVDSITPRVSEDLRMSARQRTGIEDNVPVQREPYIQWVLEACELPFDLSSVGVEFVPDVAPYELLKLRVLNASHSLIAFAGSLLGYETVSDAVSDTRLQWLVRRFMQAMVTEMKLPDSLDAASYIETTLDRFANPGVQHLLQQVAEDGSSKLKERVVPALLASADSQSALICLPIVFWIEYIHCRFEQGQGIVDPAASQLTEVPEMDRAARCLSLLGIKSRETGEQVSGLLEQLRHKGVESFLGELV